MPALRTLESRLLVTLLALAIVPALLLSLIASGRLAGALDRLQNPGSQSAGTHAPRLYRELVDRWRTDAEPLLAALPHRFPAESEAVVKRLLEESGLDFAAWHAPDGELRVIARGEVDPVDLPVAADWGLLRGDGAPPTLRDRTLRFFREEEDGSACVVGVVLPEDLAVAMGSVGREFRRYAQLGPMKEIQKRMVWISTFLIFLLAAAAAALVARITARRISRPVAELARAADRVAAGQLSARAEATADGEIGDLVSAFNRMTERLERSQEELLRMERVAAWRDVARRIAHEIRNPLTPVQLAVHRLRRRLPDDPEAAECLRSIGEEVENLSRISESFSEFAKMPEAEFAATDLAAVARSVVELFRGTRDGITVSYEGPEELPLVADRDHLRRAVTNLVKNATEAMAEAGMEGGVRVRVSRKDRTAVLEVTDDGPGVPAQIRETLFRPGTSARTGGSGLGLAMVHRIAVDHRGTLRWSDRTPGTSFVMEVPLDLPEDA